MVQINVYQFKQPFTVVVMPDHNGNEFNVCNSSNGFFQINFDFKNQYVKVLSFKTNVGTHKEICDRFKKLFSNGINPISYRQSKLMRTHPEFKQGDILEIEGHYYMAFGKTNNLEFKEI